MLTLGFGYGTTANNGNVMSQTISGTGIPTFSQNYTYDGVNRLWTMSEASPSSLQRTYTYDAYGNRAVTGTQVGVGTPTATSAFTASNNRMTSVWASYDVAGNQLSANRSGAQWSAAYDGENKQVYFCAATTAVCNETNAAAGYVYDGEGNRVQKLTAGVTDTFVYDAFGRLAAEYSTGPGDAPGRYFRTTDHLGSTRLVTNAAMDVVSRRDFFPFGEQILANTTSGRNGIAAYNAPIGFPQLFTGKERDEESGLDYFLARYYSGALGRFTSPDEWAGGFVDPFTGGQVGQPGPLPYADITDPQTVNKYAYVRNNPLRYTDPDGHCFVDPLTCLGVGLGLTYVVDAGINFVQDLQMLKIMAKIENLQMENVGRACIDGIGDCNQAIQNAVEARQATMARAQRTFGSALVLPGTFGGGLIPTSMSDLSASGISEAARRSLEKYLESREQQQTEIEQEKVQHRVPSIGPPRDLLEEERRRGEELGITGK